MTRLMLKIAVPVILAGVFIIVIFAALNYSNLDANLYLVFSFLLFFVFLFGFASGQAVSVSLEKILQTALRLGKGDTSKKIFLETKDEFSELAEALNMVADRIKEGFSAAEQSEKTADMKISVRTRELQETINALEQKIRNRTFESQKTAQESESFQNNLKQKQAKIYELQKELEDLRVRAGRASAKKTKAAVLVVKEKPARKKEKTKAKKVEEKILEL